jgi:hypothetical protein
VSPPKNPQSLNCLSIHPKNLIRLAADRRGEMVKKYQDISFNLAVASGNRNIFFTQKQHIQNANNP